MKEYVRFSYEERIRLARLLNSKMSISNIAIRLGRERSSIRRELKRNKPSTGEYKPETAHAWAQQRRKGDILQNKKVFRL